jgi:hypothetical protein
MPQSVFTAGDMLVPKIEEASKALGEWAAGGLGDKVSKLPEWLQAILPEVVSFGGGGLGAPRAWFPAGKVGDLLHKYANDALDSFMGGAAAGLKDPKSMDPKELKEALDKASDKALRGERYLALGLLHVTQECSIVQQYKADASTPAGKGKDGKDYPGRSNAKILPATLEQALREGIPLCPKCCVGSATPATLTGAPAATSARPAGKPDSVKLTRLFAQMRTKDPSKWNLFHPVFQDRCKKSPAVAEKFIEVFAMGGTYDDLDYIAALRPEHWNEALDGLRGKHTTLIEKIGSKVQAASAKFFGKIEAEGAETADMVAAAGEKLEAAVIEARETNARLTREREERRRARTARKAARRQPGLLEAYGWPVGAILALAVLLIVLSYL